MALQAVGAAIKVTRVLPAQRKQANQIMANKQEEMHRRDSKKRKTRQ